MNKREATKAAKALETIGYREVNVLKCWDGGWRIQMTDGVTGARSHADNLERISDIAMAHAHSVLTRA